VDIQCGQQDLWICQLLTSSCGGTLAKERFLVVLKLLNN
jgi:hypothetical protein